MPIIGAPLALVAVQWASPCWRRPGRNCASLAWLIALAQLPDIVFLDIKIPGERHRVAEAIPGDWPDEPRPYGGTKRGCSASSTEQCRPENATNPAADHSAYPLDPP